jgi:hypothetical protein
MGSKINIEQIKEIWLKNNKMGETRMMEKAAETKRV